MPAPSAISPDAPAFDRAALLAQARAGLLHEPAHVTYDKLTGRPPQSPSDFDLNPEMWAEIDGTMKPRDAAVLIPIIDRDPLTILLTTRAAHLPAHAGQIAFPGGKLEPEDEGPLDAALRETEEEIGLDRRFVTPLGYCDGYWTRTGFRVTPVVALVSTGFDLTADPREVDDTFEVPFEFLMSAVNHRIDTKVWQGRSRAFYAMPYHDRYIWGATAGMLKSLHHRLGYR
ncbi:MAG: CoA pyrophosphatase [Pseudomonadota bacterium]